MEEDCSIWYDLWAFSSISPPCARFCHRMFFWHAEKQRGSLAWKPGCGSMGRCQRVNDVTFIYSMMFLYFRTACPSGIGVYFSPLLCGIVPLALAWDQRAFNLDVLSCQPHGCSGILSCFMDVNDPPSLQQLCLHLLFCPNSLSLTHIICCLACCLDLGAEISP